MAVKKKKKKKAPQKGKVNKLTPRDELFCRLYTQNSSLFGNGTKCYAQAFDYDLESMSREAVYEEGGNDEDEEFPAQRKKIQDSEYDRSCKICGVQASKLLANARINDRINELLLQMFTENMADREMSYVMLQREDLGAKMAATREFNKLKGRIIDKSVIKHEGLSLKDLYEASKESK